MSKLCLAIDTQLVWFDPKMCINCSIFWRVFLSNSEQLCKSDLYKRYSHKINNCIGVIPLKELCAVYSTMKQQNKCLYLFQNGLFKYLILKCKFLTNTYSSEKQ